MQIMHCSHVQQAHQTLSSLTQEETNLWNEKKVTSALKAGCFGATTRVFAATTFALWACREIVFAVPRLFALGVDAGTSWKTVDLFNRVLRTTVLQGVSLATAMILPEVLYRKMEVERYLFVAQLETLIETLPSFPEVPADLTDGKSDNFFEPIAKMWVTLGFTDAEWRDLVQQELFKRFQENPRDATQLLDLKSAEFRKVYLAPLFMQVVQSINVGSERVDQMDITTLILLFSHLTEQAKERIFAIHPDYMVRLEDVMSKEGALFQELMGYRYRSKQTIEREKLLFQKMKEAKKMLIQRGIYEKDDIESQYGTSYAAVISLGILGFIESDSSHWLHGKVRSLSVEKKEALIQRLYMDVDDTKIQEKSQFFEDPEVVYLFGEIGSYKWTTVDYMMKAEGVRNEDKVTWSDAFFSKEEQLFENLKEANKMLHMKGISSSVAVIFLGTLSFIQGDPKHYLYNELCSLPAEKKEALKQRLYMNEGLLEDPQIEHLFQEIGSYKTSTIDPMMQAAHEIDWSDALGIVRK